MKKGYLKLLIICLSMIILAIINAIYPISNNYFYIFFLLVIFVSTIYFIGFEKDKLFFEKDLILVCIFTPLFFLILTYMLGLFIGFNKNGYSLIFSNIIKNIFVFGNILVLKELIRYNLIKKGSLNKSIFILVIIVFILMDLSFLVRGFNLTVGYDLLKFIFLYAIPLIFTNILLTYITFKGGYKPSIIYSSIITLPMYFMPIFPDLGIYMDVVFQIIIPFVTFFLIYKMTDENTNTNLVTQKFNKISTVCLLLLTFIIIGVSSGWFKYQTLVIATGSMEPNISIGDVVVVEKISQQNVRKIEIGQILVFWNDNNIIVHRVIDVKEVNGRYDFYTRGDANNAVDNFIIREKDVIGIVKIRIPLVGYPTLELNKIIKK